MEKEIDFRHFNDYLETDLLLKVHNVYNLVKQERKVGRYLFN